MMARANVVFPQPDSPARARTSPSCRVRSTPSTAVATDAVSRRNPLEQRGAPGEADLETSDLDDRLTQDLSTRLERDVAHVDASDREGAPDTWMQAARRPSPAGQRSTSVLGQASIATEQRGWKGQPDGMC